MWKNNINNQKYIGSSENLRARFIKYFNVNHLLRNTCLNICKALVKHGYSNFSLTILEYCEPSKCLIREKHYWDIFKPEYNIAQDPTAPFSGRKHSDKSKTIMSEARKGKTIDDGTILKISDALKGKRKGKPRTKGSGKASQLIEVFDLEEKTTTSYNSFSEAARALNLPSHKVIFNYILRNQKKPYKVRYTFAYLS